ncbi:hypothetical protein [Dongia sp.]|uniref:hypothetical protein n=1 Tax=Dongia sp. TaxID=1977262 RepID=UPI0035ADD1CC
MGFSQGHHARRRVVQISSALLFSCSAFLTLLVTDAAPSRAEDEVECSSLRLQMSDAGYDNTCFLYSGATGSTEVLETNAIDGSHFLVVADRTAKYTFVFVPNSGFRAEIADSFNLTIEEWRSGKTQQNLKTAEFVADLKHIPSDCVAFERNMRREYNGYRRRIVGFGCSRTGDREKVYAAMRHVTFPE